MSLLVALAAFTAAFAQSETLGTSQPPMATAVEATLSEVLVTGEQSGPGLWKVSKGDHVLWIFGLYAPLPKKMIWRSKETEQIIAQSQELLTTVEVKPNIGFFRGLTLLPLLIGLRNNPADAKLKDVVPTDLYSRWLALKEKYIGHDSGIEKWRPSFAAGELYEDAIDQWGFKKSNSLIPTDELQDAIKKIAKKHKVKVITLVVPVDVEKPRAWVKEFKKSPINDLACFANVIDRLETDKEATRMRANAWAVGNVAALRPKVYVAQQDACAAAFFEVLNLAGAQERGFQNIPARVVDTWVAAAEAALARNSSTFAVLSIDDIYRADGYVAKLRAKGYAVEEP